MSTPREALVDAARVAGHAPSLHNSQPWRWRVAGESLRLYAARERQLGATDPDGRLLTVSCGTALHHALVALEADGWPVQTALLPEPADPDLLAVVTLGHPGVASSTVDLALLTSRRTDRRPVAERSVPADDLAALVATAAAWGAALHVLRPDDVIELASAADRAQRVEALDEGWQEELTYWAGAGHPEGMGVPDAAIPAEPPQTTVPGRDFGHPGALPTGPGHDGAARYALLYGEEDAPPAWLRSGEALSAVWLAALARGLTVLPLSAAVEVAQTRQALRGLLAGIGEPHLVLRIGVAPELPPPSAATPRLPAEQTISTD